MKSPLKPRPNWDRKLLFMFAVAFITGFFLALYSEICTAQRRQRERAARRARRAAQEPQVREEIRKMRDE